MTDKIIDIPIDIFNEMDYAIENLRYKILELNSTKPSISVNINDYLPLSENKKNSFTWSKDFEQFSINIKYNYNSNFSKKELLQNIAKILHNLSNDNDESLLNIECEWCELKKDNVTKCDKCNRNFCDDCRYGDDITPEGVNCCELDE